MREWFKKPRYWIGLAALTVNIPAYIAEPHWLTATGTAAGLLSIVFAYLAKHCKSV